MTLSESAHPVISLPEAYVEAKRFVQQRSQNFHMAAGFLPPDSRWAAWATYAFFRRIDDLVDHRHILPAEFQEWREQAMKPAAEQTDPILAAWAYVRERYSLNAQYIQELLDGVEMDLVGTRFETLEELQKYCYRVASAASLLALPVLRFSRGMTLAQVEPYVAKMGIAVQLSDILCDVGEDLQENRIYLPRAELARFGLSYADIESQGCDERFKELMKYLIGVTRNLYEEAWPMMSCFSGSERLATGFAVILYRSGLDEIEQVDFDVFKRRIHFSLPYKVWLLMAKWPTIAWPRLSNQFFK